jgi:hypothetical protein
MTDGTIHDIPYLWVRAKHAVPFGPRDDAESSGPPLHSQRYGTDRIAPKNVRCRAVPSPPVSALVETECPVKTITVLAPVLARAQSDREPVPNYGNVFCYPPKGWWLAPQRLMPPSTPTKPYIRLSARKSPRAALFHQDRKSPTRHYRGWIRCAIHSVIIRPFWCVLVLLVVVVVCCCCCGSFDLEVRPPFCTHCTQTSSKRYRSYVAAVAQERVDEEDDDDSMIVGNMIDG